MGMDKGTQGRESSGNGMAQGSAQENEQIIRRMFNTLNEHNSGKILPYLTENVRYTAVAFNETYQGHDGFTKYLDNWIRAFPDYKLEVTNIIASGSKAVCEFTARGNHTGPLRGSMGEIPATNKRVELKFVETYEMVNGRISVARNYFDLQSLMTQIGMTTKH